jgi:hypothetical protein
MSSQVSYEIAVDAPDRVLRSIRRVGELSLPDLVLDSGLPYDVVISSVKDLCDKGQIDVSSQGSKNIEMIRVKDPPPLSTSLVRAIRHLVSPRRR